MEALDGSETEIRSQIEQHQQKCEGLEIQAAELMDAEEAYQENVNAVPVFDVQQELNQWQTHQIVAKNALGAARQRAQDHKGRLDDAKERLSLYRERIGMIQSGLKDIQEQEVLLKADIDKVSTNIAEIEKTQIDPLTQSQNEVEKSVLDLQRLEDQSHKKVIIAERQYTQLQLELDRRNDQLENLVQKIEDDFGLVAYDYENGWMGPIPCHLMMARLRTCLLSKKFLRIWKMTSNSSRLKSAGSVRSTRKLSRNIWKSKNAMSS